MTKQQIVDILERAFHAWKVSNDPTYKEILGSKIHTLETSMHFEYETGDINSIPNDLEMADHLAQLADDLDKSI